MYEYSLSNGKNRCCFLIICMNHMIFITMNGVPNLVHYLWFISHWIKNLFSSRELSTFVVIEVDKKNILLLPGLSFWLTIL